MPRALISVTDKTGLAEFVSGLCGLGYELVSTGGTATALRATGVEVIEVSELTGFPEMLDGRVKTLHPKVHGGLLGDLSKPSHGEAMASAGIVPIDLLVVNLYAFEKTVTAPHEFAEAIEAIDIGGPAMIRAAAKNGENVLVVVDPADYEWVLDALHTQTITREARLRMMAKAFRHTAFYDSMIARYLSTGEGVFTETMTLGYRRGISLRYGENPHQRAALYLDPLALPGFAQARQTWGKELSYNNLLDGDAAWGLVCDLPSGACAIIKHGNPCGAAVGDDLGESYRLARASDPISAFGGIAAFHGNVDLGAAEAMTEKGNFLEVVIAEGFSEEAMAVFRDRSGWGQNVRLLAVGRVAQDEALRAFDAESKQQAHPLPSPPPASGGGSPELPPKERSAVPVSLAERWGGSPRLVVRSIDGGVLIQEVDFEPEFVAQVVTKLQPDEEQMSALRFAWTLARHIKSNAIVVAQRKRLLGVGAGQMNRVQSVRLALEQAGENARGAALASDAFFPFPDSIETAAVAGIAAIIQPGGSKKDNEVIAAADRLGLAMIFTGVRHFRH